MGKRFSTAVLQRLGSCFSSRVLSVAAASVVAAPLLCAAGTIPIIPNPIWQVSLQSGVVSASPNAPGNQSLGPIVITASGSPFVLDVQVLGGIDNFVGDLGVITLIYRFAVVGPVDGTPIPMAVSFTEQSNASAICRNVGSSIVGASVSMQVTTAADQKRHDVNAVSDNCGGAQIQNFTGLLSFMTSSGVDVGAITMGVSVSTTGGGGGEAFEDPFIFIDPDFLRLNPGYSVIVSAGISNAAPAAPGIPGVPEPATLLLFVSGLLGFVALRRRRI